ncbi:MAG: hypothetical protein HOV79_34490 [Hamadaea sp.]|nr:hypothetical protein [Hamadaea sp.]
MIHLAMRDLDTDIRDEILVLRGLCALAVAQGIDVSPVLAEVALMSSDVDRFGMGSMKSLLLRYSHL